MSRPTGNQWRAMQAMAGREEFTAAMAKIFINRGWEGCASGHLFPVGDEVFECLLFDAGPLPEEIARYVEGEEDLRLATEQEADEFFTSIGSVDTIVAAILAERDPSGKYWIVNKLGPFKDKHLYEPTAELFPGQRPRFLAIWK